MGIFSPLLCTCSGGIKSSSALARVNVGTSVSGKIHSFKKVG